MDPKGVEPASADGDRESVKSALRQVADAPLPLEIGSVAIGADGHIACAREDRPLSFRFSACGVEFEASLADRRAPLRLRAQLGKLPYSAQSPEARSLARTVLGATARLRNGHILLTPEHDMVLAAELMPPDPRTPASVIATAVALVLDFRPYLQLLGEAVALHRDLPPAEAASASDDGTSLN